MLLARRDLGLGLYESFAMAPRRHHQHGHGHDVLGSLLAASASAVEADPLDAADPGATRCCVPTGDCLRANSLCATANPNNNDYALISLDDLRDTVRVTCNNEHCTHGRYMHRECFDAWEQTVLTYLKTCGRARSWSERQRHQNLWTKKGYDLAYKACGCKCGRGHLKKDLDWMPPPPTSNIVGRIEEIEPPGKKKKKKSRNSRPALAVSAHAVYHPNCNANCNSAAPPAKEAATIADLGLRARAGSLSSSNGSSSPPVSASSEPSVSPSHSGGGGGGGNAGKKKSRIDFFSDRVRVGGGANGIFTRRLDFSSFNSLPRNKLNSYQIKMEDEGNHGNDDTRCFILSTLAGQGKSRVQCVLCDDQMLVFDRYPLVDGTFFLSPRQHTKSCIEVKVEGRTQFLSSVCMACLEGWPSNKAIWCRFCKQKWDGSNLVIGTMYSYDIFAAMPCCTERIKCNSCYKPVLHPQQRLNFFSDYSHMVPCPHCRTLDTHFVKPLVYCYTKQAFHLYQRWP